MLFASLRDYFLAEMEKLKLIIPFCTALNYDALMSSLSSEKYYA
jgi:hypothetical protein